MAGPQSGGAAGGALVSLSQTDSEGHFRLENIPPGRYYIQAGLLDSPSYYPGVATLESATLIQVQAGGEVEGLDFALARSAGVRVSGRVPLTAVPRPIQIRLVGGGGPAVAGPVASDGSFEFLRVRPGSYTVALVPSSGIPSPSFLVGGDDDVVLGLPAGPAFKVSGHVGLGPQLPKLANQRVIFTGSSAWAQAETEVDAAGNFELSLPPGQYSVRTLPGTHSPAATVTIVDREVAGLRLPAFVELSGRAIMTDGGALPIVASALMVEARRRDGVTIATAVRPDGTFRLPLTEGEFTVAASRLPSGTAIQSFTYGATDLLQFPLRLEGSPEELRLTLSR